MPRSLILGVNGQDGSYLAETLLRRGHEVIGVGRTPISRYVQPSDAYRYIQLDLTDSNALLTLLRSIALDYAFHFASVHGSSGFRYEGRWRDMMAVNVLSLHALLEHARTHALGLRVIYAGSAKIFPAPLRGIIDEDSPSRATCLYSIGKIASRDLIAYYRAQHNVRATNLILFNHESPRRPPDFLLPTIARAIKTARADPGHRTTIRTLDFHIDWSAADELMDIVADIAERTNAADYVLASGKTWHGRGIVQHLFARHGLIASNHIEESLPPSDPGLVFQVRLDRLEQAIGRRPQKTVDVIVDEMIAAMSEGAHGSAKPAGD